MKCGGTRVSQGGVSGRCADGVSATDSLTDTGKFYNALVQSWPEISRLAREGGKPRAEQGSLFDG